MEGAEGGEADDDSYPSGNRKMGSPWGDFALVTKIACDAFPHIAGLSRCANGYR